jgi:APA family basic amino acid/polyamine antiporter
MTQLARILNRRDLTLLTIGGVIGSGIFLVPGPVMKQSGGLVGPAMLVWLLGGILSLLGALTYGELSAVNPKAGGIYVHLRDCFGPLPAFLFGWTLFFAMNGATVATLAVAFSNTLGQLMPLSDVMARVVSLSVILVLTLVNVWGTRSSADLQNWTTALKVGAILLITAILLVLGHGFSETATHLWPDSMSGSLASGFGLAMVGVLWAYEGWQYPTFSAGEVIDPQRNYPHALFIGTASLIFMYLIANVGYLAALGPAGVAKSESAAADALTAVLNPTAAKLIAATILVSVFSAANSNVLTCPRVYYAMANDGLFFRKLGEVHPRFGTPAFAIIAGSLWSAVLAMAGTFNQLLTYVVFSGWVFYGLAAATIFVYRRRVPEEQRPYKVPGYPWTPILFILAATVVVLNTLWNNLRDEPKKTAFAIGVIVLGLPVYFIWRARRRPGEAVATEAATSLDDDARVIARDN